MDSLRPARTEHKRGSDRLATLLGLLNGVTVRGSRYVARCPAHADKSPSLQVTEGETAVLLHCWAGCTLTEICSALGLKAADLFYDAGHPRHQRPIVRRPPRIDLKSLAFEWELAAFDRRRRAGVILEKLTGIDLANVSDSTLDRLLAVAAKAYADLDRAELLETVADGLRVRAQSGGVAA